jgi:hypothetical protein
MDVAGATIRAMGTKARSRRRLTGDEVYVVKQSQLCEKSETWLEMAKSSARFAGSGG